MKIKKYKGATESEIMLQIKEELGKDALIVSVKNIKPKGAFKFWKKPFVEITAAVDDRAIAKNEENKSLLQEMSNNNASLDIKVDEEQEIKDFMNFLGRFSKKQEENDAGENKNKKQISKNVTETLYKTEEFDDKYSNAQKIKKTAAYQDKQISEKNVGEDTGQEKIDENPIMKVLYEQILENEVDERYANKLLSGIFHEQSLVDDDIDSIVSIIYKRIVNLLSDCETIESNNGAKNIFFIGPTGVGKTTTIAKIASVYALNMNKKVALITSDTYRIAAVEQLRTYANILGVPIKVVYTEQELQDAIEFFKEKDLVLIDTAGRSHRNEQHKEDLLKLVSSVEKKEIYLVLSMATKYDDMLKIARIYKEILDYKIIFTKLDETFKFGNILNIKLETESKLSYVTFGQNVPDDISEINPHQIARNILGGDDFGSSE